MARKTIKDVEVASKRVLIRVDFNVPIDNGKITDDRRIRAAAPTIRSAVERGGRAILMSHLGRPSGAGFEAEYSLKPVADRLGQILGRKVAFPSNDCVDDAAAAAVEAMTDGDVLLLENLRFHKGETKADPEFARKLARYADIYVNDAFGTAHRPHASMAGVPRAMGGKPKVAGFLMESELKYLADAIADPKRPFVLVIGGAKVSSKLAAIENLLPKADAMLIGGAMAYTFLKARGAGVGASRVEEEMLDDARRALEAAEKQGKKLLLPTDHVCAKQFIETAPPEEVSGDIPDGLMGLDIGPETRRAYAEVILSASTIVWNGPMGVFEWDNFAAGTRAVGEAIARATDAGATSIVGGGDTASAAEQFDLVDDVSHVSTGGGASLEMLEGKPFEAVELLDQV
ncbi:MAG: phosphoglycerate kinase [Phycisphaerales bacterium JB039]